MILLCNATSKLLSFIVKLIGVKKEVQSMRKTKKDVLKNKF